MRRKTFIELINEHNALQPNPPPKLSEPVRKKVRNEPMKVRILKEGPYSAFHNLGGVTKASMTWREIGDVVEYPVWYAESLVESKLAALVIEVIVPEIVDRSTAEKVWPVRDGVDATDGARRLAEEIGVDLARVKGTGKDGRIIISDVGRQRGRIDD